MPLGPEDPLAVLLLTAALALPVVLLHGRFPASHERELAPLPVTLRFALSVLGALVSLHAGPGWLALVAALLLGVVLGEATAWAVRRAFPGYPRDPEDFAGATGVLMYALVVHVLGLSPAFAVMLGAVMAVVRPARKAAPAPAATPPAGGGADIQPERGKCLVCGEGLTRPLATCADCATPYHPGCLEYNGRCAVYGCTGLWSRGAAVASAAGREPSPTWILDISTGRERAPAGVVAALALLTVCIGAGFLPWDSAHFVASSGTLAARLVGVLIVFAFAAVVNQALFDDHLVLQSKERVIFLHRRTLWRVTVQRVASFEAATVRTVQRVWNRADLVAGELTERLAQFFATGEPRRETVTLARRCNECQRKRIQATDPAKTARILV